MHFATTFIVAGFSISDLQRDLRVPPGEASEESPSRAGDDSEVRDSAPASGQPRSLASTNLVPHKSLGSAAEADEEKEESESAPRGRVGGGIGIGIGAHSDDRERAGNRKRKGQQPGSQHKPNGSLESKWVVSQ